MAAVRSSKGRTRPSNCRATILLDPSLESFATLLFPHFPRASNELSDGLRGKEEIGRVPGFEPIQHGAPGTWPYGLADHVGIQKKGHQPKSADRPVDLSRSIESSASVSGEATKEGDQFGACARSRGAQRRLQRPANLFGFVPARAQRTRDRLDERRVPRGNRDFDTLGTAG